MISRHNSRAGLTLIEVLIAVSLLSLLTLGIFTAMHLGFSTMDKTDARLVSNRRVVNARRIVESEIDGFIFTHATFMPSPDAQQSLVFFEAEPQSMRFVTSYSLQDAYRGRAQVASLQVVPGDRNEGVRLIVNEIPWTGPTQTGQMIAGIEINEAGQAVTRYTPTVAGSQSFVLADKLRYCRFSYLENMPIPPFQMWHPEWILFTHLPAGIRIEMEPLDPSPANLHVTTVTVPLNVSLTPGVRYAD